jgi:hemerythrin
MPSFLAEEELMDQVDYPAALRQRMVEQHQGFTMFGRERVMAFRRGEIEEVSSLQASIKDFLMVHEAGTDRQLADWITAHGG